MVLCLIVGCGNKTGKEQRSAKEKRFFRVPRVITHQGEYTEEMTAVRRRKWISAISRDDLTDSILATDRVCSKHFVSGQAAKDWDRYNVDWVPTFCLGHSKQQLIDPEVSVARAQRATERRKRRTEIIELEVNAKAQKNDEPGRTVEIITFTENVLNRHEQKTEDQVPTAMETMGEHDDLQTTADKETQTVTERTETQATATQTEEFDYLFKETVTQPFTESYFENNEDRVRFYTGLPGFDVLKVAFGFVSPYITRRSKTLSLFQEFIMVLMKLRLNVIPLQDLAFRFGVSVSTVSRTFSAWMMVMDIRLSPLVRWPEREELWHTMPMCFQYAFGKKTTIIIDCFEVFIERPSNLLARSQTFSSYKHHNTVKVLIGISPQGSICFVSKAWGGRTSDKYLTERCGLLDNLKPGDLVMADRGFAISESVGLYQAKLVIPAFTRGKDQLNPIDVEKTRGIANVRIHVERVIGLLRQKYTILQSTLPLDYLTSSSKGGNCPLIDRMIRICAALTNLCPSVAPFD